MKKQAKILALILSLCLIFGVIVATTAFADTTATETNQLDKSYLEGITKTAQRELNRGDTEAAGYAVTDYLTNGGTKYILYSGPGYYHRNLQSVSYDSIAPSRTNKYMEMRNYSSNSTAFTLNSNSVFSNTSMDYYVVDFDMTATQYLIYFKTPYFVDRDGDDTCDNRLSVNTHLGYVTSAEDAAENEAFTHALGTFSYDAQGNITAVNVDSFFFMEQNGTSYFPRYLETGEDKENPTYAVDTTYSTNYEINDGPLYPYTEVITDADILASVNDDDDTNDKFTYHASYDNGTMVWFPINSTTGAQTGGSIQWYVFDFDTFEKGGRFKINGNVKTVYLSNEVNVWDHVTIITAYNEIDSTYYCCGYILLNGELVHKVEYKSTEAEFSNTNGGRHQLQLNRMDNSGNNRYYPDNYTPSTSNVAAYSLGYDNWTSHTYSNDYVSADYLGLDDYIESVQTGANNVAYTDCVDVVYDADYLSPNPYAASVDGELYANIDSAAANITQNSTITIAEDLLDYTPAEDVTNFTVVTLNGAEFSLSDEATERLLYAAPAGDGSGYTVRPLGEEDVVRFDYYYGDIRVGTGAANRLDGLVLDSSLYAYTIADRTNGVYVLGDGINWTWNYNEEDDTLDAENFYPVDLGYFDIDYFNELYAETGLKLIIKGEPTQTATATGYMIVDYIDGAEKVVPNVSGTYDYLSQSYTAATLAAAFRADFTSANNNGKTIVLTCGYLLDVDGVTDGDNAESIKGFDLYSDTRQAIAHKYNVPANTAITLDLNGRTLVNGSVLSVLTGSQYANYTFALGDGSTTTIYSSIPGGEIIHSIYGADTTAADWTNYMVGSVFQMAGVNTGTLNLGRYVNPNTGVIADGDNLRITGAAMINMETNANATDVNINIDGGYYYTTGRTQQGMFRLATANTTINVKNADIVHNQNTFSMFNFGYYASGAKGIELNITDSNLIAVNANTGVYLSIIQSSGSFANGEVVNITGSTLLGNNGAAASSSTVITIGEGCVLSGSNWNNTAIKKPAGVESMTIAGVTVPFTAHFNYALKSNVAWTEGFVETENLHPYSADGTTYEIREYQLVPFNSTTNCYYMSDRFYELITKDYVATNVLYTYETGADLSNVVSVAYKNTEGTETYRTDYYFVDSSVVLDPPSVPLYESNGWYVLGTGPDSWTVAVGDTITENTVATPVESKLVPTAAVQAKYSVSTASYIQFILYLPQYTDLEGNPVNVNENVSGVSVTYTNKKGVTGVAAGDGGYKQVAENLMMKAYSADEIVAGSFSGSKHFTITFIVTIEGTQHNLSQDVDLTAVQYATDILEQRNGTVNGKKDVMWGYAYLNYVNSIYKAITSSDITGAADLLTRYETETADWVDAEGNPDTLAMRWAAYKAEMDSIVAASDLDYSGLSGYVKGFAWVYSMEKPHLVAILDYAETTADLSLYDNPNTNNAALKEGANLSNRIYQFTFYGNGGVFNGKASYYYRTWNRAGLLGTSANEGPYEHIYIWDSTQTLDELINEFDITLKAYDENGEATITVTGSYSMAEYIKWARAELGTEGTEVTQNDVDTAEAAYLLSLAFRDFKNYVPEDAQ